jgi:hypothetical protein
VTTSVDRLFETQEHLSLLFAAEDDAGTLKSFSFLSTHLNVSSTHNISVEPLDVERFKLDLRCRFLQRPYYCRLLGKRLTISKIPQDKVYASIEGIHISFCGRFRSHL